MRWKIDLKTRLIASTLKVLLFVAIAGAGVFAGSRAARAILLMEELPWTIPSSTFAVGGGEVIPRHVNRTIVSSIGTSSVNRMEGGSFVLGTGIVGAISPSQANLDNAHAYPVPFIPSQGHTTIFFTNITTIATIRIYTLSGELVKTIRKADPTSDRESWSPVA
ncbi:MAG: hypothetical protein V3S11_05090, partial [Elusimicrobiota bacterium]